MSLDVYLTLPGEPAVRPEAIYIRRDGATVQISREEWDELNPGREPSVLVAEPGNHEVYTANVTHNLEKMAREAGLYEVLWQPEEHGYTRAGQLIMELRVGLGRLLSDRAQYEQFNPANGWGNYDLLVRFTESYLAACEEYPEAEARVWK